MRSFRNFFLNVQIQVAVIPMAANLIPLKTNTDVTSVGTLAIEASFYSCKLGAVLR